MCRVKLTIRRLRWREKWPLVAVTNGNAQPEPFGLERLFCVLFCVLVRRTGDRNLADTCIIWRYGAS